MNKSKFKYESHQITIRLPRHAEDFFQKRNDEIPGDDKSALIAQVFPIFDDDGVHSITLSLVQLDEEDSMTVSKFSKL